MPVETLPVWSFAPNWDSPVMESRQWLTDILESNNGSSQRRSLRLFPRLFLDFEILLSDRERTFYDNFIMENLSQRMYMPLWYDVYLTTGLSLQGGTSIVLAGANTTDINIGDIVFICGEDDNPFVYELAEITGRNGSGFSVAGPLIFNWFEGAKIYPTFTGTFSDTPNPTVYSDDADSCDIIFKETAQKERSDALVYPIGQPVANAGLGDVYRGFCFMDFDPNTANRTRNKYQRKIEEIDNEVAVPYWTDTIDKTFYYSELNLTLRGRAEHKKFANFMNVIRGRQAPIWVSTYRNDLILYSPIASADTIIQVTTCGYTLTGGPKHGRKFICLETANATRHFAEIESSTDNSVRENLTLSEAFGADIALEDVVKISFMVLMRLDHDVIDIKHLTDTNGASEVTLTFVDAPDTRNITSVFE